MKSLTDNMLNAVNEAGVQVSAYKQEDWERRHTAFKHFDPVKQFKRSLVVTQSEHWYNQRKAGKQFAYHSSDLMNGAGRPLLSLDVQRTAFEYNDNNYYVTFNINVAKGDQEPDEKTAVKYMQKAAKHLKPAGSISNANYYSLSYSEFNLSADEVVSVIKRFEALVTSDIKYKN